jgi:hypothetical protein
MEDAVAHRVLVPVGNDIRRCGRGEAEDRDRSQHFAGAKSHGKSPLLDRYGLDAVISSPLTVACFGLITERAPASARTTSLFFELAQRKRTWFIAPC